MEIQQGANVTITGDILNDSSTKNVYNYSQKEEEKPMTDIDLLRKINYVKGKVEMNNRLYFPICCYMMWRGRVAKGDFKSAVDILEELVPGLQLDYKDLSKCYVYSFTKELDMWNESNAPVHNSTFSKYVLVGRLMYEG